jgi:hypothetical protein
MTYVTRIAGVAGIFVLWVTAAQAQDAVVTKDPALDSLIASNAKVELVSAAPPSPRVMDLEWDD